jgi:hypothetical protein
VAYPIKYGVEDVDGTPVIKFFEMYCPELYLHRVEHLKGGGEILTGRRCILVLE